MSAVIGVVQRKLSLGLTRGSNLMALRVLFTHLPQSPKDLKVRQVSPSYLLNNFENNFNNNS